MSVGTAMHPEALPDTLILDARCEMAMATVTSPLDVRLAYEHCRRARRCARRAGACAPQDAQVPAMFADSALLTQAWLKGLEERVRSPPRLQLIRR